MPTTKICFSAEQVKIMWCLLTKWSIREDNCQHIFIFRFSIVWPLLKICSHNLQNLRFATCDRIFSWLNIDLVAGLLSKAKHHHCKNRNTSKTTFSPFWIQTVKLLHLLQKKPISIIFLHQKHENGATGRKIGERNIPTLEV